MFWFQEQAVKIFYSALGSSYSRFPSAVQSATSIGKELETILKKMYNQEKLE